MQNNTLFSQLIARYRNGNMTIKLIFVNVAVFVVTALLQVVYKLFFPGTEIQVVVGPSLFDFLALPSSLGMLVVRPWSLLTYMFMHDLGSITHILFNMLTLYWFGDIFLRRYSVRHMLGLYILGGLGGAALFLLATNVLPFYTNLGGIQYLVGASASILALLIAAAIGMPNFEINLLFIGRVKMKYLAIGLVVIDLLFLSGSNGGGHIAHLGGALMGYLFAINMNKGRDITKWVNASIDSLVSLWRSFSSVGKPKMRVSKGGGRRAQVHSAGNGRGKHQQDVDYNAQSKVQEAEIDAILDKLRKSGYESLSKKEKQLLFDVSKRHGKQ